MRQARLRKAVQFPAINLGGNGRDEMARLVLNLTGPDSSTTGNGRFISYGHSYWGVGPTIAWHNACTDPLYPVGRLSVEKFADALEGILSDDGYEKAVELPGTYVSLGPGTGEKDVTVLSSLGSSSGEQHYIGVDVSAEMLRLQLEAHGDADSILRQMIAVQLDFSVATGVSQVAHMARWQGRQGHADPVLDAG